MATYMKIGIFGSGMVGQTLAAKLAERGQDVMVSSRSAEKVAAWAAGAGVKVGSLSETAADGEIVINATKGEASVDALRAAGEANLAGKILMDIANPLDSRGGCRRLSGSPTPTRSASRFSGPSRRPRWSRPSIR